MSRPKKYFTEEEKLAAKREKNKRYYQKNTEKVLECVKRWQAENREEILERKKEYHNTPMGRAVNLIGAYRQNDKNANRGECTLTTEWVMENIFTKPCHYCGESDWSKIGCDRIINDLPHTPENVVPCCEECNKKRGTMNYEEFCVLLMKGK